MKMNFRKMKPTLLLLMIFWGLSSYAVMERGNYSGSSSSPAGTVDSNDGTGVTTNLVDSTGERCEPIPNGGGQYLSQEHIRRLIPVGEIKITGSRDNPKISIPRHISVCTRLTIHSAKMGNDFMVRIRNAFPFTPENTGISEENFESKSIEELHEACIKKEGFLTDGGIDYDKAVREGRLNHELESSRIDLSRTNKADSVNLYFASPKASEYGVAFPAIPPAVPSRTQCLAYENIGSAKATRIRTSEKDRRMDQAIKVCESKDPQELINEIARNYNDGYEDIAKILEKVLEDVKAPRITEIYKRMDEIELALKDDGDETASMEQASELILEYAKLAKEVDKIQITPALTKMRNLIAERRSGVSKERREEIERQMGELRKGIKEFSTRSPSKSNLRFVYENAQRYALTDEIKSIESLRLSSNYYGKIGFGSRNIASIRAADDKIERRVAGFGRVTRTWEDEYSLRSGNDFLLTSLEKEIKRSYLSLNRGLENLDRANRRNMKKYCSRNMLGMIQNQVRCNRWRSKYPRFKQRELKKRKSKLAYLESLGDKFKEYEKIYKEGATARRKIDSEFDDDFEVYGEDQRVELADDSTARESDFDIDRFDEPSGRDPLSEQVAGVRMYPNRQPQGGQQGYAQGPSQQPHYQSPGIIPQQQVPYYNQMNQQPFYGQNTPMMTPFNPATTSYMHNGGGQFQYNNSYNPMMLQFSSQGPSQMYNGYQGMQQQGQIFGPTSFSPMMGPSQQMYNGYQGMQQPPFQGGRMPAYMGY